MNSITTGSAIAGLSLFLLIATVSIIKARYKTFTNREFVLLFRNGKLIKQGYGGAHFILPIIDEIIVLSTTVQTQEIKATEIITAENQDVLIQGFVVWRIEDPVKAYQSISGAQNKGVMQEINKTLTQLVESIIRTTVARLTLDQVLRERSLIIEAILDELHPVVEPLGIVISTAEIKHIEVVDKELFQDLQEKYKQEARLQASKVKIETDREIQKSEAEAVQQVRIFQAEQEELARIRELEKERKIIENRKKVEVSQQEKELAVQTKEKQREAEVAKLEKEKAKVIAETELMQIDYEAQAKKRKEILEKIEVEAEKQRIFAAAEAEKKKLLAQAEADAIRAEAKARQEAVQMEAEAEARRLEILAEATKKNLMAEAEGKKAILLAEAEGLREKVRAQGYINEAMIMQELIKQLPAIAASIKVGDINWLNMGGTSNGTGESPLGIIPKNMLQIMALAKSFGLDLEQLVATIKGQKQSNGNGSPNEETIEALEEAIEETKVDA